MCIRCRLNGEGVSRGGATFCLHVVCRSYTETVAKLKWVAWERLRTKAGQAGCTIFVSLHHVESILRCAITYTPIVVDVIEFALH